MLILTTFPRDFNPGALNYGIKRRINDTVKKTRFFLKHIYIYIYVSRVHGLKRFTLFLFGCTLLDGETFIARNSTIARYISRYVLSRRISRNLTQNPKTCSYISPQLRYLTVYRDKNHRTSVNKQMYAHVERYAGVGSVIGSDKRLQITFDLR